MINRKMVLLGILLGVFCSCAPGRKPAAGEVETFDSLVRKGIIFVNLGDYGRAKDAFDRALALDPRSVKVRNLSGITAFRRQDYASAERHFREAVLLDPSFATGYNNLGGVYAVRNELDKAKEMYEKAISLSPGLVSAYYSLGTVYFLSGDSAEGTRQLAEGIRLDPNFLDEHGGSIAGLTTRGASLPEMSFALAGLFASTGNVERTVEYLGKAGREGFKDWRRIAAEKGFDPVREDPRVRKFIDK
jgi:Flp pilus assembly protein TadD